MQAWTGQHRYCRCVWSDRCTFVLFSLKLFRVSGYCFFYRAKGKTFPAVTAELELESLYFPSSQGKDGWHKDVVHRPLYFTMGHCEKCPPPPGHRWWGCALPERELITGQARRQEPSWLRLRDAAGYCIKPSAQLTRAALILKKNTATKSQKDFVLKASGSQIQHEVIITRL